MTSGLKILVSPVRSRLWPLQRLRSLAKVSFDLRVSYPGINWGWALRWNPKRYFIAFGSWCRTLGAMDVSNLARIFRDNVNHLLDEQGLSRSELARRASMRQPVVAKILNGETEVMTDTIERFANALEVPAAELIREHIPAAA
jgi:hypothetical protein